MSELDLTLTKEIIHDMLIQPGVFVRSEPGFS